MIVIYIYRFAFRKRKHDSEKEPKEPKEQKIQNNVLQEVDKNASYMCKKWREQKKRTDPDFMKNERDRKRIYRLTMSEEARDINRIKKKNQVGYLHRLNPQVYR